MKRKYIYITIPKCDIRNVNIDSEVHSLSGGLYGNFYSPSNNRNITLELRNDINITNSNMAGMLIHLSFIRDEPTSHMFDSIQLTFNNTIYTMNPFGRFSRYMTINAPVIHMLMDLYGTSKKEHGFIEYMV